MANVNVTSDAWTEISIKSGTIQNISATADIELSEEQTDNSGVVLKPSELYQWDNETIFARAVTEKTGALRVVNFKKAAGGGGGYVLPVATASKLGGVKIGSNISIDADGVLSATGGGAINYSTTEQLIGTWIDGKPFYQKTYSGTTPATTSYANIFSDSVISTIDKGFIIFGSIFHDGDCYAINENSDSDRSSRIFISPANSALRGGVSQFFTSEPIIITIRYTKTTD